MSIFKKVCGGADGNEIKESDCRQIFRDSFTCFAQFTAGVSND